MRDRKKYKQVLAIDPTPRGLAFAMLQHTGALIDWGRKKTPSAGRNARCVEDVAALIRSYGPDVLVLEDCGAAGSRRCRRVRALIRNLHALASSHSIPVESIAPRFLREACTGHPHARKHEVARALATRFPELARQCPPPRKPWMAEDARMHVFDAAGLAVSAFYRTDQSRANRNKP